MAKLVQDASLTYVANAIRAKTGGTDQLTFPSGFVAAIEGITTGGGATEPYIEETFDVDQNLIGVVLHGYTWIRPSAFYNCSNLILTSLPSEITKINNYAFSGCASLALAELPSGVTNIGNGTFRFCANLTLTSLPSRLAFINQYAFKGCTGLTSITFEGTPTLIASNAFDGCTNLTSIKVPWAEGAVANAPWGATNATITYNYTGEGE